jgi:hypothetical protein
MVLCFNAAGMFAQSPPSKAVPLEPATEILSRNATSPDIVYFRDANGELVRASRVLYDEFVKFLDRQNLGNERSFPSHAIEGLTGVGRVHEGWASIDWELEARVTEPGRSVVSIPVRMRRMHLSRPQPDHQDPDSLLSVSPQGYLWWLRSDQPRSHRIRFSTLSAVEITGNRAALGLDLPLGPLHLKLLIPGAPRDLVVADGESELGEVRVAEEGATVDLRGSGGNLQLKWQLSTPTADISALQVVSQNRMAFNEQTLMWEGTSRLAMTSKGSMQSVDVVLAPGFRWVPPSFPPLGELVSIVVLPAEAGKADEAVQGTRLRLRFNDLSVGEQREAEIKWECGQGPRGQASWQLTGPTVKNAQRHTGIWTIDVPSRYRLSWNTPLNAPQVQKIPSEPQLTSHTFRFVEQPVRMTLELEQQGHQMKMEPVHHLKVSEDHLEWSGQIDFSVDPSKLGDLRLQLGPWKLERIQGLKGNAIDLAFERQEDGAILPEWDEAMETLDDDLANPGRGWSGLRFWARRPWNPRQDMPVAWSLPRVQYRLPGAESETSELGSGYLCIEMDENLRADEATWQWEGLSMETASPDLLQRLKALLRGNVPDAKRLLAYRFQSDSPAPWWKAQWQVLPQQIFVDREFDIALLREFKSVVQRFRYRIDNKPLNRFRMWVPENVMRRTQTSAPFQVSVNGKNARWTAVVPDSDDTIRASLPPGSAWRLIELTKDDQAWDKQLDVEVRTEQPYEPDLTVEQEAQTLWLVRPWMDVEPTILSTRSEMTIDASIDCEIPSELQGSPPLAASAKKGLLLQGDQWSIACRVRLLSLPDEQSVALKRVWLQTSLNSFLQQDRCVIQFRTLAPRIEIELPSHFDQRRLEYYLDGKPVKPWSSGKVNTIFLNVPVSPEGSVHVLEFWNRFSSSRSIYAPIAARVPLLIGATPDAPMLWQIVVPRNEHLVFSSQSLVPEFRWEWADLFWARKSHWTQPELEQWVGGSVQPEMMSQTNQYVMSVLGHEKELQAWILPRHWLWFPLGGTMLLFTAIALPVAQRKNPWLLLGVLAPLMALTVFMPDLAVLLSQWMLVGLLLILTVLAAGWVIDRRVQRRSIFKSRPSSIHRQGREIAATMSTQSLEDRSLPVSPVGNGAVE